jgi:hypothetical protein
VIVEGASWSAASLPIANWTPGELVQTPIHFFTPATLPGGVYAIAVDSLPAEGKSTQDEPAVIGQVYFRQRPLQVAPPVMTTPLTATVQFGTHATLLGYDLNYEDGALTVVLHWQVLQTLLPPHHIFVHLDATNGATVAQSDDIPVTSEGPAPTATWRPGEYLTTHHHVAAPQSWIHVAVPQSWVDMQLLVGLYIPETGVRLPASRAGQPIGDSATLPLIR